MRLSFVWLQTQFDIVHNVAKLLCYGVRHRKNSSIIVCERDGCLDEFYPVYFNTPSSRVLQNRQRYTRNIYKWNQLLLLLKVPYQKMPSDVSANVVKTQQSQCVRNCYQQQPCVWLKCNIRLFKRNSKTIGSIDSYRVAHNSKKWIPKMMAEDLNPKWSFQHLTIHFTKNYFL